jgi:PhnB protein
MPAKPSGYSTVSPYLIASGAQAVIDFLKQTFGAEPLRRYDLPDGSIMHAEVRIGDTVVMIGEAGENWPAVPAHLHVYVEDVDATYRRALEAGGVSVQRPERKGGDDDRRGGVKDPAGNTWWIATQVEWGRTDVDTWDTEAAVSCPYCGEMVTIGVDPDGGAVQTYVEDCQVCCQPWQVHLTYDDQGTAHVWVETA